MPGAPADPAPPPTRVRPEIPRHRARCASSRATHAGKRPAGAPAGHAGQPGPVAAKLARRRLLANIFLKSAITSTRRHRTSRAAAALTFAAPWRLVS
jgi:hypothetical protein